MFLGWECGFRQREEPCMDRWRTTRASLLFSPFILIEERRRSRKRESIKTTRAETAEREKSARRLRARKKVKECSVPSIDKYFVWGRAKSLSDRLGRAEEWKNETNACDDERRGKKFSGPMKIEQKSVGNMQEGEKGKKEGKQQLVSRRIDTLCRRRN